MSEKFNQLMDQVEIEFTNFLKEKGIEMKDSTVTDFYEYIYEIHIKKII